MARRIALKGQIAATTDALRNATTAAEVQNLSGVLIGLSSMLNNTDYEIHHATASAIVQDIANRTGYFRSPRMALVRFLGFCEANRCFVLSRRV